MRTVVLTTGLMLCLALPAHGQEVHAAEISGGYSYVRDGDFNLHGWIASVTGNVTPSLGIVAEAGGNSATVNVLDVDVDTSIYAFTVGPRFTARRTGAVPFGQLLFGAARASAKVPGVPGASESMTKFAVQPGAGVDVWLRRNVGLRFGADYRRITGEDGGGEGRVHAGVVIGAGTR